MPGGRFQAPADEACLSCLEGSLSVSRRSGLEGWSQAASSHSAAPGPEQQRPPSASEACPKLHLATLPGKKAALEVLLLDALLDLVDRHWNGCRSLHGNEAFLGELAQGSADQRLCPLLGSGPLASLDPSPASLPSVLREHPEGPAHGVWVLGRGR